MRAGQCRLACGFLLALNLLIDVSVLKGHVPATLKPGRPFQLANL